MKTNSAHKTNASETTLSDAPPNWPNDEVSFLEYKSDVERAALRRTGEAIVEDLKGAADPASWVRRFPWPATVTAAILGFFLGWQVRKPAANPAPAQEPSDHPKSGIGSSTAAFLASTGIGLLKEILVPVIQERLQSKKPADPPVDPLR